MISGYALHPEALTDIDEIALYTGEDHPETAHRVVGEIERAIQVRDYLIAYAPERRPL